MGFGGSSVGKLCLGAAKLRATAAAVFAPGLLLSAVASGPVLAADVGRVIEFQDASSPNFVESVLPVEQPLDSAEELAFTLPGVDSIPPPDSGVGQSFVLQRIVVEDMTVFKQDVIDGIVVDYTGRSIGVEDVDALRIALNQLYLTRGYVNSGVIVPPQDVASGELRLVAVEGSLTDVQFASSMRLRSGYVERRLRDRVPAPLNVGNLQNSLRHLERDANINRIGARLVPGEALGQSVLELSVAEPKRFDVTLGADNHRASSVGEYRGRLSLSSRNLTGWGEELQLSTSLAEKGESYSGAFALPIGHRGLRIEAYGSMSDASIVEDAFVELDIKSDTSTWGVLISRPLFDGLNNSLTASVGFEARRSESELLGERFSFSPGAIDGVAKSRAFIAGLDFSNRGPNHVASIRTTYRKGVDALDATVFKPESALDRLLNPTGADGLYDLWFAQGIYLHRLNSLPGLGALPERSQLVVRSTAQLTWDALMSLDKVAIGGVNTVRGYRENLLVRDNGVAATVELQFPVPGYRAEPDLRNLIVSLFADYGRSWDDINTDQTAAIRDTTRERSVTGAGLGFLWQPIRDLRAQLYWAHDIADNFSGDDPRDAETESSLQGDGVHFSVSWTRQF